MSEHLTTLNVPARYGDNVVSVPTADTLRIAVIEVLGEMNTDVLDLVEEAYNRGLASGFYQGLAAES